MYNAEEITIGKYILRNYQDKVRSRRQFIILKEGGESGECSIEKFEAIIDRFWKEEF